MNLKFDYFEAQIHHDENRHAMIVMAELGIKYQHATPQSLSDFFWFWNCKNVPIVLPGYLTELAVDPRKMIGFGLSEDDAERIARAVSS